jgi:predicted GNAT family acetyltransferase
VATVPDHRGREYARAVVVGAARTARGAGAEFVFLVADANDWPKELYRRLGFDELGHYAKFFVPGRS